MATPIQIIKDLIGSQDINWGDSTSSFNRQTHTGGTTPINYIDAECIPSTTLGGYIGDNLHIQHTDTGTTQTTFTVNSSGDAIILSSSGLSADRTFTFPNTSNQALVGATDLLSIAASKGASLVGIQDSSTYYSSTTVEGALAEIGVDIAAISNVKGYKSGFKLGWSSATAVTIGGGMWEHRGTTTQYVYTNAQITFILGPGESNPSSDNLGNNEIHYIYIDDSAVVSSGSALLTATEFVNDTTAPTYSHSKVGWYNGNDRCVGAILTDGSAQVKVFYVRSDDYYCYGTKVEEFPSGAAPVAYAALDVSSSVPVFSTHARAFLQSTTAARMYYFALDASSSGVSGGEVSLADAAFTLDVVTTDAQVLYWYANAAATAIVYINGYFMNEL